MRDGERIVVNGAVLRSLGRTSLSIESKATILKGRDLMDAADATTPARRLYHACIAAYVDPEGGALHQDRMLAALAEVMATLHSPVAKAAAARFARLVAMSDHYRALADCRALIAIERGIDAQPACDGAVAADAAT